MTPLRIVRFGTFEFDCSTGELRNGGRRVPLQSQPAQVLAQLVSRPGDVVPREALRRAIWTDDTFVEFDTALNVAVNKIRQALRDSATAPRFIETVPKRGYRFLADVHSMSAPQPIAAAADTLSYALTEPGMAAIPEPEATVADRPTVRRFRRLQLGLASLIAISTAAAVWSGGRVGHSSTEIRSVAVLPFRPLVAGARDEALEVGLTEAIIVRLGQTGRLRVPSIYAVQHYARLQTDPAAVGRELRVDSVVEGSLLRANDRARLSARLIDVHTGASLWAQQWDLPWTDIFAVQDTMAAEVSRALAVHLDDDAGSSPPPARPTNIAAYDRYLRARHLLRRRTVEDSKRAAAMLTEAIGLDPGSAAAHATLGFAYISVAFGGQVDPFVELSRQATARAIELDPSIAEAHAVRGRILLHFDREIEAGRREMQRSFDLDPRNPFVQHCYSETLADDGRFEEAMAVSDRALAQDPASVLALRDRALFLFLARRYDESVATSLKTLELDPYAPFVHGILAGAYEQMGQERRAFEAYIAPLTLSERNREKVAALRAAVDRGGIRGFWKKHLEYLMQETEPRSYAIASAYVRLGDHDRALAWLEKHANGRGAWIRALRTRPEWDPLRQDPRFQALLRRAG